MKVLIGIPAYNESQAISGIVCCSGLYGDVLVVDDGSTDDTSSLAKAAGAEVIRFDKNFGVGHATTTLISYAKDHGYECLVTLDADGQHDPKDIPLFVRAVESGLDVVLGNRFLTTTPIPNYRKFGIKIVSRLVGVDDSECGFRAYSKKALETLQPTESSWGVLLEIIKQAKHHHLMIAEVPCLVSYSQKPKRNPLKHGLSLIDTFLWLTVYSSPLLWLGVPALILLAFGGTSTAILIEEYTRTKLFILLWAIIGLGGILSGTVLGVASIIIWAVKKAK